MCVEGESTLERGGGEGSTGGSVEIGSSVEGLSLDFDY